MRRFVVHLCWFSLILGVAVLAGGCTLENIVDESPEEPPPGNNTPAPPPDSGTQPSEPTASPSNPGTPSFDPDDPDTDEPGFISLPTNPSVPPNPSGTSRQLWYFGYKSYDNTFRIRWPTYFATQLGVGPGSYTMIDGQRARFRSFDTDYGARRPSYTIPGPSSRFRGEVLCILYSADGTPLAWFKTNADRRHQGRLP